MDFGGNRAILRTDGQPLEGVFYETVSQLPDDQ
jgi:hypothetical protein